MQIYILYFINARIFLLILKKSGILLYLRIVLAPSVVFSVATAIMMTKTNTPFGGIFQVREQFSRYVGPVIDKVLGLRCTSFGYQYSEIAGSLASVYFCGGDCVEDVTSHLMPHLSLHPTLRTCSSDTILRAISELATGNMTYTSDTGKSYEFNPATKLNSLLVKALLSTGQLVAGASYDLDFDHQFIETEKYDAKMTYKKFTGFGWGRLPKSFMAENTVFLLLTAIIRRSALPLALARTSTSFLWTGWTRKPSD